MNEIEDLKAYLEKYKELIISFESNPNVLKYISKFNLDVAYLMTYDFNDLLRLFCLTDICDKEYVDSINKDLLYLNNYLNKITYLDNEDSFLENLLYELVANNIPTDLLIKDYNYLEKKEIFNELKLSIQYKNYLKHLFINNNKIDFDALYLFLDLLKNNNFFTKNLLRCIFLKYIEYAVKEDTDYKNIEEIEQNFYLYFPSILDSINQIKKYLILEEYSNKKIVFINNINKLIECINNEKFININNCFNDVSLLTKVDNYNEYIKDIKIKRLN